MATLPPALCAQCGKGFQPKPKARNRPPQQFCSKSCATAAGNARRRGGGLDPKTRALSKARKRRMRLNAAPWDGIPDAAILDRDRWTCQICKRRIGRTFTYPHPRSASVDHILPLSLGGDDTQWNKRAAHLGCNMARGNIPDAVMPLPFGAAEEPVARFYVKKWRDCEICGERRRRSRCKLHSLVRWCRRCNRSIPCATTRSTACGPCRESEQAEADWARGQRDLARQEKSTCSVVDCDRPGTFGAGCCAPHYHRLKRHGDVLAESPIQGTGLPGGARLPLKAS